ncbi:helix-turn-helix domain-containing protein [Microbacterium sp. NM3R9]|uniref:GlxA family transcriptional regulator n=1 Tax=Microbacterium thalli TaxID=3027921 RepID=UPI002366E9A0|nr:helix-turn-helix domain-containing protein [Microbacterium thalli]MDN8549068.1 helix-turn-helix domain-containing protein [Microbacterium thalli]
MKVAIYAFDGATMFHLSTPQLVFDEVRRQGVADWTCTLFSDRAGSIRTAEGYTVEGVQGLAAMDEADMVVLPSWERRGKEVSPELRRSLQDAHQRGVFIAGLCLGAIVVADAGILAGRTAVTHWQAADELAARHPDITVDASALYVDLGDVLTSAGTASGLDACLHIVRTRLGADTANHVARSLVVAPHRDGGQAQYIERPVAPNVGGHPVADSLEWALTHLAMEIDVEQLASRAHMSRRSYVRAFRAATGTTPAAWVRSRRLDETRRLLETTDLSIDQIADASGFGSPVTLRQNFLAAFGCTPSSYRRRFDARALTSRST